MSQNFVTTDVLRLEVEDDPTGLANMVQNPSGDLGAWGWITPIAGAALTSDTTLVTGIPSGQRYLRYTSLAASGSGHYFYSEAMPISAGQYAAAYFMARAGNPGGFRYRLDWLDSSFTVIGSTAWTTVSGTTYDVRQIGPSLAPAGTAYTRLRMEVANPSTGAYPWTGSGGGVYFREATVAKAATSGALGTLRTNLVPNPSFETNTTNWSAGVNTTLGRNTSVAAVGTASLAITAVAAGTFEAVSNTIAVTGTTNYAVQARFRAGTTGRTVRLSVQFNDATSHVISTPVLASGTDTTSGWTTLSGIVTSPGTATAMRVRLVAEGGSIGDVQYIDAVMVEQANSVGTYFDGSTAAAGGFTYAWTGTAHASTSTATSSNLAYIDPVPYVDILGPTHDIKVNREALNIGTLTATVLDATLDPSQDDLIRPGKRVRLMVLDDNTDAWTPLFTGKATEASVTYVLKDPTVPSSKRARITLTAVDATSDLANQKRSEGVTTLAELPYVLEGCGVPWNVLGSGNQVPSATVVAYNDNASALDQIAITRDTNSGRAWVDTFGTLRVIPYDGTGRYTAGYLSGYEVVTDLDLSYNTGDCINEVTIKYLRLNPTTGETEEIAYGPYRNETSISEWGVRSATFTIQGLSEETSAIPDLAAAILATNSEPIVVLNSLTAVVKDTAYLKRASLLADVMDNPFIDWEDDTGYHFYSDLYITTIEHSITPDKWTVKMGFRDKNVVASPTYVPSPNTGAGGQTIGQLLRPIGEVTMFYGSSIPAGWLKCDGSTFSSTTYPDLAALLGGTTLPNFTDRFPIGAGTKALGTSGGAATRVLTSANLPPHAHDDGTLAAASAGAHTHGAGTLFVNRKAAAGSSTGVAQGNATGATDASVGGSTASDGAHTHDVTGSTGNGPGTSTAVDILNPWRAVNFIIRAV